jgi:hypothetical protein
MNENKVIKTFIKDKEVASVQLDPFRETADIDEKNNSWNTMPEPSRFNVFKARQGQGPRGGGGQRGGAPANPIVLSRNGRSFTVTGATNVRAGTEIKVETQAAPVNINLSELDSGSWVIFELPGFTTTATGTAQSSLDALRSATSTSYYKGENALWVKVVSTGGPAGRGGRGGGGGGTVQVSK